MFYWKLLIYFSFLYSSNANFQVNLYYTDDSNRTHNLTQNNCLRLFFTTTNNILKKFSFCLTDLPSTLKIEPSNSIKTYTFQQLKKQNITSEHLYLWSTPIDIIEQYQLYLNTNNTSLAKKLFYKCILPRFGPQCQYQLMFYDSQLSSLYENIERGFGGHDQNARPFIMTCYDHLECHRSNSYTCLDWTEICDGHIDCLNDGIDEKDCWQLEINQCNQNEYRCSNGECISILSHMDKLLFRDCFYHKVIVDDLRVGFSVCNLRYHSFDECDEIICPYSPLTSSCSGSRQYYTLMTMYINDNNSLSSDSWLSLTCYLGLSIDEYPICREFCDRNDCIQIINQTYPEQIFFPQKPILFGNLYFVYMKHEIMNTINPYDIFPYVCYTTNIYNDYFRQYSSFKMNNFTCIYSKIFSISDNGVGPSYGIVLKNLYVTLRRYHLTWNYTSDICEKPQMYQCIHSPKCISVHRLFDGIHDCPYTDDENQTLIYTSNIIEHQVKDWLKHRIEIGRTIADIDKDKKEYIKNTILFQYICDRIVDLLPIIIDGQNHTDETECQQWECDNLHTHCQHGWSCLNGQDETGCPEDSDNPANCSRNFHTCVSPETNQFICLPLEKANDGNIDCLSATDEDILRVQMMSIYNDAILRQNFYCRNQNSSLLLSNTALCNNYSDCEHGEDERFCTTQRIHNDYGICIGKLNYEIASTIEKFLCDYKSTTRTGSLIYFQLQQNDHQTSAVLLSSTIRKLENQHQNHCYQGVHIRIWLNEKTNSFISACLCPPYYYGLQCQYQNQRVNLLIKFQTLSDSLQTLFTIFFLLIDNTDQRIIHSYEQLTYSSVKYCQQIFQLTLIYGDRSKNLTTQYQIHVDIFETLSLKYRGSLLFPIQFSFLPVHRLGLFISIPPSKKPNQNCQELQCQHGRCIRYWNNTNNQMFCQCEKGWTGKYCSIPYVCQCASNSTCLGISLSNNRSVCVCPKNTFGSYCLINTTNWAIQKKSLCLNRGELILTEDYLNSNERLICLCQKGFNGHLCEIIDSQLTFEFNENIKLTQSIIIHFINIKSSYSESEDFSGISRSTTFQTINYQQKSVIIHWSQLFHLVFIELLNVNKHYYLAVVDNSDTQTKLINKTISTSDRCLHINEIFNQTFLQWHLIRRIKYYHLPCQNQSLNLKCFHDEKQFCLCYDFHGKRLANCFQFEHNLTYDCSGRSLCENNGRCSQDHPTCPTRTTCFCQSCYSGQLCQFSTDSFGYSLDALLGYSIQPNKNLSQQPSIIKISLAFIVILFTLGMINGVLSLITFKNKSVQEVGCGLYLLGISMNSLLLMIFFALKFCFLLLTQMEIITNDEFFRIQCHSIDFLLRICLEMDQWLNACIALERVITAIQGARFDKKQSRKAAKFIVIFLYLIIIGTSIHDPIYRRIILETNEDEDKQNDKKWCIVRYDQSLRTYDYTIHTIHFFGPFFINIISSIVLILKKTHQQLKIHRNRTYKDVFRDQIHRHKHLLIAPLVLILLAMPRLILISISKCMESNDDIWLFLAGYFISFVPSMMSFLVFVMPLKFYKKEFRKTINQYRKVFRRTVKPI